MSLPNEIGDREFQKFQEDENGEVSVRIAPDSVRNTGGNVLEIDTSGRARTFDLQTLSELKDISEKLSAIIFQLQIVTGVESSE